MTGFRTSQHVYASALLVTPNISTNAATHEEMVLEREMEVDAYITLFHALSVMGLKVIKVVLCETIILIDQQCP